MNLGNSDVYSDYNTADWLFSASSTLRVTSIFPSLCEKVTEADADSSPHPTVHQVLPGGHAEETVQGEPVREQLESRNTQIYVQPSILFSVCVCVWGCWVGNKGWASVTLTLLIVSWSTGTALSQHTRALASGSESICEASESPVMDTDRSLSGRLAH